MLLSVVSVLVVAQSSSEVPEGLMNNPVLCPEMDFDIIGFECSDCTSCELIKHILLSLTFIFSGSKGGIIHAGK